MSRILVALLSAWWPITSLGAQDSSFIPRQLSPFATQKAERLLQFKLPCLGCHRVDRDGGQIGPDLTSVGARRTPNTIYEILRNPAAVTPGTIMPQTPMTERTLELIASYLSARGGGQGAGGARAAPLSSDPAPEAAGAQAAATLQGRELYAQRCSACHGTSGAGDGFNATFLPTRPTVHSDSAYMSGRSDDALFDVIHAGGYVMNRSNRMPAFGRSLTNQQIRSLVRYMRELCRCSGPAWARDGQRGPG